MTLNKYNMGQKLQSLKNRLRDTSLALEEFDEEEKADQLTAMTMEIEEMKDEIENGGDT